MSQHPEAGCLQELGEALFLMGENDSLVRGILVAQ